jgi:hypothetical protein
MLCLRNKIKSWTFKISGTLIVILHLCALQEPIHGTVPFQVANPLEIERTFHGLGRGRI